MRFSLARPLQRDNAEYPFTLIVERNRLFTSGVSLTKEVKGLRRVKEENVLHISAADAARLGVDSGPVRSRCRRPRQRLLERRTWTAAPERTGYLFASINPLAGSPSSQTELRAGDKV